MQFIRLRKPVENSYVESFNDRLRDECLNENWFATLDDARVTIERWRQEYNAGRPHSSLRDRTPAEFTTELLAANSSEPFTARIGHNNSIKNGGQVRVSAPS